MNAIQEALQELKQAQQNFEYAEADYIDIAIMQIRIAEMKYTVALKGARA